MGGLPPVRFVPSFTSGKKEEGEEDIDTVKITISNDIQKYYPIFKEGDPEQVVNLIKMHEGIVEDKKLRERFQIISSLIADK